MIPWRKALFLLVLPLALPALGHAEEDSLRRQAYLGAALAPPAGGKPGAEVVRVRPETAAEAAGFQVGDRILKVNGRPLDSPVAFETFYGRLRGGDTAEFEIQRQGETLTKKVTLPDMPRETYDNLDVFYGSVTSDKGHRQRTIVTRPKGAAGRLPGLLLVGWLSCAPVDWPLGANAGYSKLLRGVATDSGFVMMRVEKPGVGDSEGPPCIEVDFETELAGYRAALRALKQRPDVDPEKVFIFGMSNGGGIAPLVAQDEKVRGYLVTGGWVKTWFEHMIENERRVARLRGLSPGEVSDRMRGLTELYTLYLIQKMKPGDVIRQKPALAALWQDLPGHQYGRPAAFYQQLQDLNLEAAWDKVEAPVLVVYGEHDHIMSREDHEMIAGIVNRRRPGSARFVAIPKMDHLFYTHESMEQSFKDYASGTFDPSLIALMVSWMKDQI